MKRPKEPGFGPGRPEPASQPSPQEPLPEVSEDKKYKGPSMQQMVERISAVLAHPRTAQEVVDEWKAWSDRKPGEMGEAFRDRQYPEWDELAFSIARRAAEIIMTSGDTLTDELIEVALIQAMQKELASALIMKERMGAFVGGDHAAQTNLDNTDAARLRKGYEKASGVAAEFSDEDWEVTLQLARKNRKANLSNW